MITKRFLSLLVFCCASAFVNVADGRVFALKRASLNHRELTDFISSAIVPYAKSHNYDIQTDCINIRFYKRGNTETVDIVTSEFENSSAYFMRESNGVFYVVDIGGIEVICRTSYQNTYLSPKEDVKYINRPDDDSFILDGDAIWRFDIVDGKLVFDLYENYGCGWFRGVDKRLLVPESFGLKRIKDDFFERPNIEITLPQAPDYIVEPKDQKPSL